ncbi:MAG: hypothetical protein ABH877_01115, partial [bacterium]
MISYDLTNIHDRAVGKNGLGLSRLEELAGRAAEVHAELTGRRESGALPFYGLPDDAEALSRTAEVAQSLA